jgi:hypothetical protein
MSEATSGVVLVWSGYRFAHPGYEAVSALRSIKRHCERSEAIHRAAIRKNGLLRRFAPLHKRFAFVAGNDGG